MSATIITFPGRGAPEKPSAGPFTAQWQDQHLPLIDAAMDLLQADDDEFRKRCATIADADGAGKLRQLAAQIDKLGSHVGDVVEALTMTAMRIRTTMALAPT